MSIMETTYFKNELPQRLLQLRRERELTQQQVADCLGLNSVTYLRYEKGQREPSLDMLIMFSRFYEVSTDYLLGIESI